jgi:serine/threonine-protein kinase HipA
MRKLMVRLHRAAGDAVTVGTLAEQDRRIYFEYDAAFLGGGIELSPFKLRTQPGLIAHSDHAFGPLFGVFDDSLPDGWGLLLMDRHFRRRGIDPQAISPLDRLAYLGTRTMGALTYHPPSHEEPGGEPQPLDLDALGSNAEAVVQGDATEVLPELMRAGGSPGGARPKVLVGIQGDRIVSGEDALPDGYEHWIVKFSARADGHEAGTVEYAYSLMARAAGIDMPPTRLFEVGRGRGTRRFFGVRRFDRSAANRRIHMHTFANLIHANFRIPSTDYTDVFKVTQALSRNHADLLRAFRLMLFNVATHNRDDHAKNFAFTLDDQTGEWSLAPAYDLTYSPGPGGEHSSTVLGEGRRPLRVHCLQLAEQFGLKPRETSPIIEQVNAAVSRWSAFAEEARCPKKIAATIGTCLHNV